MAIPVIEQDASTNFDHARPVMIRLAVSVTQNRCKKELYGRARRLRQHSTASRAVPK